MLVRSLLSAVERTHQALAGRLHLPGMHLTDSVHERHAHLQAVWELWALWWPGGLPGAATRICGCWGALAEHLLTRRCLLTSCWAPAA